MTAFTAERFEGLVGREENLRDTLAVLERLSFDPWMEYVMQPIRETLAKRETYWTLAVCLNCIAKHLQPSSYLEIGVRKGKSMAQVAVQAPECSIVGVDLWISPYAGVETPGPEFVDAEMRRLGFLGTLELLSGDSKEKVPEWVAAHPGRQFDVVVVDGDHGDEGAWEDLRNVAPLVREGGYLIFDDTTHPAHTLGEVWREFGRAYGTEFRFVENWRDGYGTGVGVRR